MTNRRRPWTTETPEPEVEAALAQLRKLPVRLTTLVHSERSGFHTLRYAADPAVYPPAIANGRLIVVTKDYGRFARICSELYRERHGEPRRKPTGIYTTDKTRKSS
jgi:hypothetical protein